MRLFLTKGLDGEAIEEIDVDGKNSKEVLDLIDKWKSIDSNKKKFKIELYNRIIFCSNHVLIDFGDWSYFFKIDMMSNEDFEQLKNP